MQQAVVAVKANLSSLGGTLAKFHIQCIRNKELGKIEIEKGNGWRGSSKVGGPNQPLCCTVVNDYTRKR